MASLLEALIKNESGGRNIPNTHQGTSSGQAQGYFQITEGTWDEFGGRKYAKNALQATPEQQAEIASKIPLKRWDPSTIRMMQATGRPIDTSRTLGENLAMNGESFTNFARDGGGSAQPQQNGVTDGPKGQETYTPYSLPQSGGTAVAGGGDTPTPPASPYALADAKASKRDRGLQMMAQSIAGMGGQGQNVMPQMTGPSPGAARVDQPNAPLIDPTQNQMQRQQLAAILARLNQGSLV